MSDTGARWEMRIERILATYEEDSEAGHQGEDELLEEFVLAVAVGALPDVAAVARCIHDRLLSADRTKWYA